MIPDEQVIELYKAAGWTFERVPYMHEDLFTAKTPDGDEFAYSYGTRDSKDFVFDAASFIRVKGDPRHSLDAGFRLLDAIAPRANVAFFYGMDKLVCKIHTHTSAVLGVDPYRPDDTPSRALAMTAALYAYVSEREAQS